VSPRVFLHPTMLDKGKLKWLDWNAVSTVMITKVLLLGFAYQCLQVMMPPAGASYRFFEIWRRWDADNYLKIAQFGYTAVGEQRFLIVFFPFYPSLVALFQLVTRDYVIAGFTVTLLASLALGLTFKHLVRLDNSERVSRYALLFLFIFPTSYFLHIPYTESLFLALVMGCFIAARKRSWLLVGILGFLACVTRINGLVLVPALAFEMWDEYRETKTINYKWLWLGLVGAGFGAYLALNYFVTGDPTMFMVHQKEHWYRYFRLPIYGLWDALGTMLYDKPEASMMRGFQELLFVAIGLAATVLGWRRLRPSYRVWMVANWLLFVSTSYVLSVPRYTLILFPLFIVMAQTAVRYWPLKVLYIVWSGLFLALFSMQFVRGAWAF
jgi:hypothetical protein